MDSDSWHDYADTLDDAARSLEAFTGPLTEPDPDARYDKHGRLLRKLARQARVAGRQDTTLYHAVRAGRDNRLSGEADQHHERLGSASKPFTFAQSGVDDWRTFREMLENGAIKPFQPGVNPRP